jgi:hypothetical protein
VSSPLLTLGTFVFEGLEAPESLLLKKKQRIAIHRMGSGTSSIDSLGEDLEVVSFRGIFSGTNASDRIRSIEYLKSQGLPIQLTWDAKVLSVIIREFDLKYSSNQWIPYELSCYVVITPQLLIGILNYDLLGSPDTQLGDIVSLLQNTGLSLTSNQMPAIITLAALDFDKAPSDALQQVQLLLDSINSQLTSLDFGSSGVSAGVIEACSEESHFVSNIVASAGSEAALVLVRNRLLGVNVCAEGNNQQ